MSDETLGAVPPPEATPPEAVTPDATPPEATPPEATRPEATRPEATPPDAAAPETTAPQSDSARPWWDRFFLPIAMAVFAALSLAHVAFLSRTPLLKYLPLDLKSYDLWARRIAAGDVLGRGVFYQDPLYPYLVGLVYAVTGTKVVNVLVLQIAVMAATLWALWRLGHTLFSPRVARIAVAAAALSLPVVYYAGKPEKAAFGACAITFAFLCADRGRRDGRALAWLGAGALLGAASLLRGNALIVAGVLVALIVATPLLARGFLARLRAAALVIAGVALVLSPVLARNRAVGGEWVFTTSQAGANLFIGNNPGNNSGSYAVPYFVRPATQYEEQDFRRHAEHVSGRKLAAAEVSSFYVNEVLGWARKDPGAFLKLQAKKALAFVDGWEYPDNWSIVFVSEHSPVLRLPLVPYAAIVAFASLGLALAFGSARRGTQLWLALLALAYAASVVAFFVFSRYRFPIVLVLILFAASGLDALVTAVRARDSRRIAAYSATVAAFLAVSLFAKKNDETRDLSQRYYNLAASLLADGKTAEAKRLAERGRSVEPANHLPHLALAEIAAREGRLSEQQESLTKAYAANASDEEVRAAMTEWNAKSSGYGAAATLAKSWLSQRESYRLRQSLVSAALEARSLDAARLELAELLRLYPADAWGLERRVELAVHDQDWPTAIAAAESVLRRAPDKRHLAPVLAVAYRNVGQLELAQRYAKEAGLPWPLPEKTVLEDRLAAPAEGPALQQARRLAEAGRFAEASALLTQESERPGASPLLFQYLANIRYLAGDVPGARQAMERALALDPGNELYRKNLAALGTAGGSGAPQRAR